MMFTQLFLDWGGVVTVRGLSVLALEQYCYGALELFITMPQRQVRSFRIGYHPESERVASLATEHGLTSPPMGQICLVVEEDLGGYRTVESAYPLNALAVPERNVSNAWRAYRRPGGWFSTKHGNPSKETAESFFSFLQDYGRLPSLKALDSCPTQHRGSAGSTLRWLFRFAAAQNYQDGLRDCLSLLEFLKALALFYEEREDVSWPWLIGWAMRLYGYQEERYYTRSFLDEF